MTKLNFILLHIWSTLAFAASAKARATRPYGMWCRLGVLVAHQPLALDLGRVLLAFDSDGRWLHAAAAFIAA